MSLYSDLKEVLTSYAQRIKGLAAADEEIKADLADLISTTTNVSFFEQGTINASTGALADSTTRIRTKTVFDKSTLSVTLDTGYSALVYAFNGNEYIGNWNGQTFIKTTSGNVWFNGTITFKSISPNYKYKIAVRKDNGDAITPSDASHVTLTIYTDVTLSADGVPADAKSTGIAIGRLSGSIEASYSDSEWQLGTTDARGNISSATTRITNKTLIPVNPGAKIKVNGNETCLLVNCFDKYGVFSVATSFLTEYTVPSDVYFVRCVIRENTYNSTISDSEISSQSERLEITNVLSKNGAFLAFSNEEIAPVIKNIGINLLADVTWERGGIDGTGATFDSTSRIRTVDYISVEQYKVLLFMVNSGFNYGVTAYDSDHNFISQTPWSVSNFYTLTDDIAYIKLTMKTNPDAWLGDTSISINLSAYDKSEYSGIASGSENGNILSLNWFNATAVNKLEIPTLASGTTVLTLGDSITAASDNTGWTTHFTTMTGVTVINKAVGGTSYGESMTSDSGHWISTQIANVTNAQWESADLVILACGTNDYGHGTPLAELKEKVLGAIEAIKAKTNVPIVIITPIRRGSSVNGNAIQTLAVMSGIISNVALTNGCNVIRGYDFPIPTYTTGYVDNMTQDGLHPNAIGANVYARSVINALT